MIALSHFLASLALLVVNILQLPFCNNLGEVENTKCCQSLCLIFLKIFANE